MALVEQNQFFKNLESNKIQSLYFLFGEEPYLIEQSLLSLKHRALDGGAADFNFSSFYAGDADLGQVRDTVETLPMMAAYRVVVLKEAQELSDRDWSVLEGIIENPVDTAVFIIAAEKIDKRKKAIKLLIDKACAVEMKKHYDNQMAGWIRHIGQNHSLSFSNDAVQLMHRLLGNQLNEISLEIQKLVEFMGERKNVEAADVAAVVSRSREESVFEFTDSIGLNDRVNALMNLVRLLDQGESEVGVVALIARHVRTLIAVHEGQKLGFAGTKLATYAGVPPFYLQKYLDQSRRWTQKKLEQTILILNDTDLALKSSPLSSHIWLENFVVKACS